MDAKTKLFLVLINLRDVELTATIEPWAEEHPLPPRSRMKIFSSSDQVAEVELYQDGPVVSLGSTDDYEIVVESEFET